MTARRSPRPALLVVLLATALVALCVLSIGLGAVDIPPDQVVRALFGHPSSDLVDNIVWTVRVPRTVLGLTAGAALGLSGALMQALTRNPLADPGILGVSAGASFGIVLAIALFGIGSLYGTIWFAFAEGARHQRAGVPARPDGPFGRDTGEARAGRNRRHLPAVLADQRDRPHRPRRPGPLPLLVRGHPGRPGRRRGPRHPAVPGGRRGARARHRPRAQQPGPGRRRGRLARPCGSASFACRGSSP